MTAHCLEIKKTNFTVASRLSVHTFGLFVCFVVVLFFTLLLHHTGILYDVWKIQAHKFKTINFLMFLIKLNMKMNKKSSLFIFPNKRPAFHDGMDLLGFILSEHLRNS